MKKKKRQLIIKKDLQPLLFMAPAFLLILFVYLIPFIASILISLTDWNGISHSFNFIGIQNYIDMLKEKNVFDVIGNNLKYFILIVFGQNILGVFLAVLLNERIKGKTFFRAVIFLPAIICTVAVGFIWNLMYDPFDGPISASFRFLNIPGLKDALWLGDSKLAIYAVILTNIWQWTGYNMVIYLAGLQSIPQVVIESAQLDGASGWKRFIHITLPMLAPSVTINMLVTSIGTLKIFDLPYIMTGGGPGHATQSLAILIYQNALTLNKMGYGTALSLVLFVFVLVVSIFQFIFLKRREEGVSS